MVSNCQTLISPSTICFSTTGTNDLYDGLPEFRSTKDTTSDYASHLTCYPRIGPIVGQQVNS